MRALAGRRHPANQGRMGQVALRMKRCESRGRRSISRWPPAAGDLIRINATARIAGDHAGLMGQTETTSDSETRAETPAGFAAGAASSGEALGCPESEFLVQLGDRVRDTRVLHGMSRRELARRSGISERYIAQIEAGKGNVSIVLLLRIAQVLRGNQ
jgi:DNA-binding XRE family transcriptional regulator